jgi:hypothetical protein
MLDQAKVVEQILKSYQEEAVRNVEKCLRLWAICTAMLRYCDWLLTEAELPLANAEEVSKQRHRLEEQIASLDEELPSTLLLLHDIARLRGRDWDETELTRVREWYLTTIKSPE